MYVEIKAVNFQMVDLCSGNGEVVAGTGEQCPPFDEARCGDGRKATEAQLLGPKGADSHTLVF